MYEKKGFTLVEMLGVIVVLGLLLVLAVPTIINQIKNTSGEVDKATQQLIFNSAKQFIDQNSSLYPTESGYVYCISLNTLVNNGLLIDNLIDFKTGQKMDLDKVVKIDIENESNIDYSIIKASECTEKRPTYVDGSGANPPVLVTGMTPIKWNVIEWEDTVNYDSEWYDYNQKKWANVKTEDGSMWVWIPRYAYKITDCFHSECSGDAGNIEIKFLKGTTNETADGKVVETSGYSFGEKDTSTHYFLHPAFTFGDEEIPGFWVAKFEASGSADDINILPNVSSLRNMTIGEQFDAAFNMRNNSKYGWSSTEVDTHMMKNTEWGAVAYLSQSEYGANEEIWNNSYNGYRTGCGGSSVSAYDESTCYEYTTTNGQKASTTHNIYGVYDMSGGAWEYVAAYVDNGDSNLTTYGQSIINADIKYKDVYIVGSSDTGSNNYEANKNKYGDAIYETSSSGESISGSWNSDYSYMPYSGNPWFPRGGRYNSGTIAGAFNFSYSNGVAVSNHSFRPVVVPLAPSAP